MKFDTTDFDFFNFPSSSHRDDQLEFNFEKIVCKIFEGSFRGATCGVGEGGGWPAKFAISHLHGLKWNSNETCPVRSLTLYLKFINAPKIFQIARIKLKFQTLHKLI